MIIRDAILDDAMVIMRGAHELADFSEIPLFPKDEDEFIGVVASIVTNDTVEVIVAEHENAVVGAIAIHFAPYMWNPKILLGNEVFWWTFANAPFKAGKMLYNEAIKRIEERGAIPLFQSLEHSPKGMDRLYSKEGFTMTGKIWMRFD
jgi:hypothetical protein